MILIEYGSCTNLMHKGKCDFYVVLDEKFCKEGTYCFPVENFSIEPFGNLMAAVAAAYDLAQEGRVCICDKGGCGRSGTAFIGVMAFMNPRDNFGSFKRYMRNAFGLYRSCPETREQIEATKILWGVSKYFGLDGLRYLTRTTFVQGTFAVHVTSKGAKFLPIRLVTRRIPFGSEAAVKVNVEPLKKVNGQASSLVLEEYLRLEKRDGPMVPLKDLKPWEVEPYALSFALFEGSLTKVLDHREGLVLLTKALS